jgi:sugar phosphate isomerase/epimerase
MKDKKYKLAFSNLAWDTGKDKEIVKILRDYDIKGLEVACSKIWKDPINTSGKRMSEYKNYWNNNGVEIVATTSLLFGHPELTIFENKITRNKTLVYLKKVADITNMLGGGVMMFGSPKNRIRGKLSKAEADKVATEFFGDIAEYCSQYNICFAIEPNPAIYGGDYILNMKEGVELVEKVKHKNFGLNLDASTIASSGANYEGDVELALPYSCHAHISEPYLKPIPNGETDHSAFASALRKYKYDKWLSIEMPLGNDVDHLEQIRDTLEFVKSVY